MPRATANTAYPTGTTPISSNRLELNASPSSALFGPSHQVTSAETTPPVTAPASSTQPALTASQRRRVIPCVQAKTRAEVSASYATSGAPSSIPSTAGTPRVMTTRKPTAWLPRDSVPDKLPHVRDAPHAASAECH